MNSARCQSQIVASWWYPVGRTESSRVETRRIPRGRRRLPRVRGGEIPRPKSRRSVRPSQFSAEVPLSAWWRSNQFAWTHTNSWLVVSRWWPALIRQRKPKVNELTTAARVNSRDVCCANLPYSRSASRERILHNLIGSKELRGDLASPAAVPRIVSLDFLNSSEHALFIFEDKQPLPAWQYLRKAGIADKRRSSHREVALGAVTKPPASCLDVHWLGEASTPRERRIKSR